MSWIHFGSFLLNEFLESCEVPTLLNFLFPFVLLLFLRLGIIPVPLNFLLLDFNELLLVLHSGLEPILLLQVAVLSESLQLTEFVH
jgi:hypothetical protein